MDSALIFQLLKKFLADSNNIESLPLHFSQRVKETNKDFTDYELTIRPEYEFQRTILSLGPDAEILSPQWLREEIKWLAGETAKRY